MTIGLCSLADERWGADQGDYAPTFVSDSITRIFGYHPGEYLEDPNFWRERVHPDDLHRVEEEISAP